MARLRDVLDRFRPAGAPGAAAPGGVPADRAVEQEVELASVFDALVADEERARRIRESAVGEAERLVAEAGERAGAIVDAARRESDAVRAKVVAEARVNADNERTAADERAEHAAEVLRARADRLMPEYVTRVRAELDAILGELT